MKINFTDTLLSLSYALDCVEREFTGVTDWHGKRVAYLCTCMGQSMGFTQEHLTDLCTCAILHDCALTEYVQDEFHGSFGDAALGENQNYGLHCSMGERRMKNIPLLDRAKAAGAVKYHHENADGSGPFKKRGNEIPVYARLIHLADLLDTVFDFSDIDQNKLVLIDTYLMKYTDIFFDSRTISCFRKTFDTKRLALLRDDCIDQALYELLPVHERELSPAELIVFAGAFAAIIDYKSEFTRTHSIGIARLAKQMAEYYGADEELAAKLYFAGALHDIGKLAVDRDVLDKPDKLSDTEYQHIKTHVYETHAILSKIKGMEDITRWASQHHEKLDGTGYPFGLTGDDLDHWSRMIAVLDIYQALTEERPYKAGMSHSKACGILQNLAATDKLDSRIVQDISQVLA